MNRCNLIDKLLSYIRALISYRLIIFLLILILPIAKDGPLNLDLLEWKFLLVLMLLLSSLSKINRTINNGTYQQTIVLVIFSIAVTIIAYSLSEVRDLSINMSLVMVTNAIFMIALCRLFNANVLKVGIFGIGIASLVISLVAMAQYVIIYFHLSHPLLVGILPPDQQMGYFDMNLPVGSDGVRVPSVFFHSNQLGHFLAVSFALFFPLLLRAENAKDKLFCGLIIVTVTSCTLLSQSRGGLIFIGLAVVMTLSMYGHQALKRWKKKLILIFGVITAGIGVFAINATAFLSRVASPDLSNRETNWVYSMQLIPDNFLFGFGRGASGYHLTINHPAIEYISQINNFNVGQSFNYWANNPHNFYLATILETGVFALVAELLLFGLMIKISLRVFARVQQSPIKALAISATTILVVEFIRGLFEAYIFWGASETGSIIAFICAMLLYLDSRLYRPGLKSAKIKYKSLNEIGK